MKYIHEICVDGSSVSSYRMPIYGSGEGIVFTVRDSETGVDTRCSFGELSKQFLGYGKDIFGSGIIFVKLSEYEVKLHRYIVDVHTIMGEVETDLFGAGSIVDNGSGTGYIDFMRCCSRIDADFVELGQGKVVSLDIQGRKTIVVNTTLEAIEFCGTLGSVTSRSGNFGVDPSILTMYRLLGQMINETGINLLTYKKVHFYSTMRGRLATVVLRHTHESDIFFTKMYLDVIGR